MYAVIVCMLMRWVPFVIFTPLTVGTDNIIAVFSEITSSGMDQTTTLCVL